MNVVIRELRIEELVDIPKLDVSSTEHAYDLVRTESGDGLILRKRDDQPPEETARWRAKEAESRLTLWRKNHAEGCKFFGAFAGPKLAGFCLVSSQRRQDALAIYSIFVDRKHRGRGIGRRLLSFAEEHGRRVGAKGLFVTTTLARGHAVEFYRKAGFQIVGLHDRCFTEESGQVAFFKEIQTPEQLPATDADPPRG